MPVDWIAPQGIGDGQGCDGHQKDQGMSVDSVLEPRVEGEIGNLDPGYD